MTSFGELASWDVHPFAAHPFAARIHDDADDDYVHIQDEESVLLGFGLDLNELIEQKMDKPHRVDNRHSLHEPQSQPHPHTQPHSRQHSAMTEDDHSLSRKPSLNWRTMRRSMANMAANYHNRHDKELQSLSRSDSTPGLSRSTTAGSSSMPVHHTRPPLPRSMSSGFHHSGEPEMRWEDLSKSPRTPSLVRPRKPCFVVLPAASRFPLETPKMKRVSSSPPKLEGMYWYEPLPCRGAPGARRIVRQESGKEFRSVYPVGWERSVLDLEARLHETMYDLAGGQHSFADLDEVPKRVLDLGTGTGLWAISQALAWPETRFVAADIVPCQTDLAALADAETDLVAAADAQESARMNQQPEEVKWSHVADRIEFKQIDFLKRLPYDAGSFDMIHIRFAGLGVPEQQWGDVLDEAIRVLRPGGILELVEMSYEAPTSASQRVRTAYSKILLDDYIAPNPVLALQMHLPATAGIVPSSIRPVYSATWKYNASASRPTCFWAPTSTPDGAPPDAIADAAMTWVRSALDYKDVQRGDEGDRAVRALIAGSPGRWGATDDILNSPISPISPNMPVTPGAEMPVTPMGKVSLAAWVVQKK